MTDPLIDPDRPERDLDERSGAGPMLATLVGILLTLIGLAVIFYRLFPSTDVGDDATTSTVADSPVESLPELDDTVLGATTSVPVPSTVASSTVPSSTVASSTVPSSTVPSSTVAPGVDPAIDDVSVSVGTTTADVSFTTPTCVNARYDYRGASSGRHEGAGYPDAGSCWTEHLALLGEWTDPLVPSADYTVEITIVDQQGRTESTTVSFTTAG